MKSIMTEHSLLVKSKIKLAVAKNQKIYMDEESICQPFKNNIAQVPPIPEQETGVLMQCKKAVFHKVCFHKERLVIGESLHVVMNG